MELFVPYPCPSVLHSSSSWLIHKGCQHILPDLDPLSCLHFALNYTTTLELLFLRLSADIVYGWTPLPSLSPAVRSIGLAATLPHAFVNWSGEEKDEEATRCTVNEASLHSTPEL